MKSRHDRFLELVEKNRLLLLMAWTFHAFLLHWFLLGFVSWDGLAYRVPPMVEVVQNGGYGFAKYNQWAFNGYVPFTELPHIPFLYVFKLPGVIIGYALVVFPLCVASIHLFLRELTGDERSATFGSFAFVAIPMVNQQPYSGYVDFIVLALLALFLWSVLRLRTAKDWRVSLLLVTLTTALFTVARSQASYVSLLMMPVLSYALFCERSGFRIRIVNRTALKVFVAGWALGVIPSVAIQIDKALKYGSPVYPLKFEVLGVSFGEGWTTKQLFFYCGLPDTTLPHFLKAFVGAWLIPLTTPVHGFFDSRNMGGGFVMVVALALVPIWVRNASRPAKWLVALFIVLSIMLRDFFLPRYSYTLVLTLTIIVGTGMSSILAAKKRLWLFWGAFAMLLLHLARPEYDLAIVKDGIGPRLNVGSSASFIWGPGAIDPFPDVGAKLVIVEYNWNGFVLPLYGERLSNRVIATVPKQKLGEGCSTLVAMVEKEPGLLVVDDQEFTKDCARECAFKTRDGQCRAYRMLSSAPTTAAPP